MGVAAEAKKVEAKDLPSANHVRSLIILQTPTKNVQKLAKKEGEESKAKLRGVIEILEGAISVIASSWRDL